MDTTVQNTIGGIEKIQAHAGRALDATPDDRIGWSPAPSARTPVQIIAHIGDVIGVLHQSFAGAPFTFESTEALDNQFLSTEKEFTTREAAQKLLDERSKEYIAWLGTLSDEFLASSWHSPFGDIPMAAAIALPAEHAAGHIAQLEYIQTMYGDRVWR